MQSSDNKTKRTRKAAEEPKSTPVPAVAAAGEESTKSRRTAAPKKTSAVEPTSSVKHRGSAKKAVEPKPAPVAVPPSSSTTESTPVSLSATVSSAFTQGQIATLAYSYWESRGFQGGSPEEDWLRAEAELQSR